MRYFARNKGVDHPPPAGLQPLASLAIVLGVLALVIAAVGLTAGEPAGADVDGLLSVGAPGPATIVGPFALAMDGASRNAAWVLEYLDADRIPHGAERAQRRDNFRGDPRVPAAVRVAADDYTGTGFDRGHLARSSNYRIQREQDATFLMSNIVPEAPGMNQGTMKQIEDEVLALVAEAGVRIWICTLPLYRPVEGRLELRVIGPRQVWPPTHVAKAVLVKRGASFERTLAWIVPNRQDCPPPAECRATVDDIEAQSGYDLFSGLPDAIENELEKQ